MDRNVVMMRPNATQESDDHGSNGQPVPVATDQRVVDDRRRYTAQLQRRAQQHVTAELSAESPAIDIDRQIAMLLQHAMERTGARRVTLFRPVPKGQRWHAATVLEGSGYYYGLIAPDSLVLPMTSFLQKRAIVLEADRPQEPGLPRPADVGCLNYLGVPIVSNGNVVAVIEAVDVSQSSDLDTLAADLGQAVNAVAEALAEEARRHGWSPTVTPSRGLTETTTLDLVLRPAIDPDDTFEISPQEWLILNQLNGELPLGDVANNVGIQFGVAATVAASLLERGLVRIGKESRRR